MSRKLSEKSLYTKKYWLLLKTLLNGKRIPCISSIYHNNKFISEIKTKCELSNHTFQDSVCLLSIIASSRLIPSPS